MARTGKLACVLLFAAALAGCAGPAYWADRRRDALDVFTFSIGDGGGIKARAGFVNIGAFYNSDFWGLRGGRRFYFPPGQRFGDIQEIVSPVPLPVFGSDKVPWWIFVTSLDRLQLPPSEVVDPRRWGDPGHRDSRCKDYQQAVMLYIPFLSFSDRLYYYTQLEVAGGLGYTARVGFNPGELLDFVLGWTGIDIFGDDVGLPPTEEERAPAEAVTRAIKDGDLARVVSLLDARPDLSNADGPFGRTMLNWAAECGNPGIVKALLQHGARVSARSALGGGTALFPAAWKKNDEVAKVLMDAGIDVNAADDQGDTALHIAAQTGDSELAGLLWYTRSAHRCEGPDASHACGDGKEVRLSRPGERDGCRLGQVEGRARGPGQALSPRHRRFTAFGGPSPEHRAAAAGPQLRGPRQAGYTFVRGASAWPADPHSGEWRAVMEDTVGGPDGDDAQRH